MLLRSTLLTVSIISFATFANVKDIRIIYGDDNRMETYEASKKMQRLASSTAGMIRTAKLVDAGSAFILPPESIADSMNLCKDQRFSDQPSSVICSGFLVGPDLLVTAGHCIQSQIDCDNTSWVFDYKVKKSTGRADIMISKDNVYKCSKVIETKLEAAGQLSRDYALVRLSRPVKDKRSLRYRTSGKIGTKAQIAVIGHPSGLPQKVTTNANVTKNNSDSFFQANLDTFGGNSGSAVFSVRTGLVEGILVRGAKDYTSSAKGCAVVFEADHYYDINNPRLGESVSRITDVPTLKHRFSFLDAAKRGNIKAVKSLASKIMDLNITDNQMNTALHLAIKYGQVEVARFLMGQKEVNINAKNFNSETPLHIAAFNNNKYLATRLVHAGADVLVKDQYGVFASQRTSYLAVALRKFLKDIENKEAVKRRALK